MQRPRTAVAAIGPITARRVLVSLVKVAAIREARLMDMLEAEFTPLFACIDAHAPTTPAALATAKVQNDLNKKRRSNLIFEGVTYSPRKLSTAGKNTFGRSIHGKWPLPSMISKSDPAIPECRCSATSCGTSQSCLPLITSVTARI